jgi:hypothetical protein
MRKALIVAASFGLSVSAANACEFMRSAQSTAVDKVAVASIAKDEAAPVLRQAEAVVAPGLLATAMPPVSQDGRSRTAAGSAR